MIDITPEDMFRAFDYGRDEPAMLPTPPDQELGRRLMEEATRRNRPKFIDIEA